MSKKENIKLGKWKRLILVSVLVFLIILIILWIQLRQTQIRAEEEVSAASTQENEVIEVIIPAKKEITDWKLKLVNSENPLPENFTIELAQIDKTRQFDKRAIEELNQMITKMKAEKITNFWIQSSYRSVENQKKVYENSIQKYLKMGKTQEEAEMLTEEFIQKPGHSEHNLGLAVDFNNVNEGFEKTKAYQWLRERAWEYGFILRYPKEKEIITKIAYEPWHWRYVGQEHAKKMKELDLCLEEYIEYLQKN